MPALVPVGEVFPLTCSGVVTQGLRAQKRNATCFVVRSAVTGALNEVHSDKRQQTSLHARTIPAVASSLIAPRFAMTVEQVSS